jgi:hypothetical protein
MPCIEMMSNIRFCISKKIINKSIKCLWPRANVPEQKDLLGLPSLPRPIISGLKRVEFGEK